MEVGDLTPIVGDGGREKKFHGGDNACSYRLIGLGYSPTLHT